MPRSRAWLLGFAVWTALALLSVLQNALFLGTMGRPVPWVDLVPVRLADWYTCAIFTPAYFWLVRRFPLDDGAWRRSVPVHVAATLGFVVVKYVIYTPLFNMLRAGDDPVTLGDMLARNFIIENVIFWAVLGVIHAIESFRKLREREVHAARLRAELATARLDALAGQLHPHFLFNTLQGISTLIHRDASRADAMLTRLGDLLRRTLAKDGGHEVTLAEELETLELYLGIARERFADRLLVTVSVPGALHGALVPRFILQPLTENAIRHGLERRAGAGRIEITGTREDDRLLLAVRDDGPGLDGADPLARRGVGLRNTRSRLRELYGDAAHLSLGNAPGGGFEAVVSLPWHEG